MKKSARHGNSWMVTVASLAAISLAGCGSGGGNPSPAASSTPTPTPTPTPSPTASPVPTPTPTPSPLISLAITPSPAALDVSQQITFTAQVSGATNTGVSWSVEETGGGTITSGGVYSAPATAGVYHVRAVSNADTSKIAIVEVTVHAASGAIVVN